jgi:hypothetical protein
MLSDREQHHWSGTQPMAHRLHNYSDEQLADEIGKLDALIKVHSAELDGLKDEFKHREITAVRGTVFVVTASTTTSRRLDTKRLRADFGSALDRYENATVATRVSIRAIRTTLSAV